MVSAAAVVGGLEALGEEARGLGAEDVDRLEVAAHEEVDVAVAVVVEGDGGDGVGVAVEPRLAGDVLEAAVPLIVEELVVAEAHHEEVGPAVVVVVEPEGVGGGVRGVVAAGDAGLLRHVGEGEIAVVAVEVVLRGLSGVGDEEVLEAVAVEVRHGHGGAQGRVAGHDLGVGVLEGPVVVRNGDAGPRGSILETAVLEAAPRRRSRRGAGGDQRGGEESQRQEKGAAW